MTTAPPAPVEASPTQRRRRAPASAPAIPPRRHRPEIQGLRALAVLLVVAYHVWLGRVSGGIDVFLLLSAFLMTSSLVGRLEAGERVRMTAHWARTFWRLVPAATAVVLLTLAASAVVLPATRWPEVVDQAWASLFYGENWLLAHRAVDYYAADHGVASPFQHFWSLSVQGQVFLAWPVLLLGLGWVARRWRLRLRPLVALAFAALLAASLGYSVVATEANQQFAYFDTRTRLWEFAAGSLLGVLGVRRLPTAARVALGWAGVGGLVACGLVLEVTRSFPGYLALWPVLCGAAVVLAGRTGHPLGVDRLLCSRPLRWLGDRSYALYLVHWPVLVLWLAATGRAQAGLWEGAAVVLASVGLATVLATWVEVPLRQAAWPRRSAGRTAVALATSLAVAAVPLAVWKADLEGGVGGDAAVALTGARTAHPGALALEPGASAPPVAEPLPHVSRLREEFASLPTPCSGEWRPRDPVLSCGEQAPDGPATRTVVVVGDSHAEQWLPALQPLARQHGWRLVSLLEGGCSFGEPGSRAGACDLFNRAALAYLLQRRPDAVVTVATAAHRSTPDERLVAGYPGVVRTLTTAGLRVVGLRDNPRFPGGAVACALEHGLEAADCAPPRSSKLAAVNPADTLAATPRFILVDLTDRICGERCPAQVGNVWVYLDDNHLTRTYATTLAPALGRRLGPALGWPELTGVRD